MVRDREIQFYLRGVLQDLDIAIDYAPELPMIDHLFDALQHPGGISEAELPPRYSEAMIDKAMDIWDLSPWNSLNEQQILAIELNAWDVETLYVSMLGMAGVEYGLLMYRSPGVFEAISGTGAAGGKFSQADAGSLFRARLSVPQL